MLSALILKQSLCQTIINIGDDIVWEGSTGIPAVYTTYHFMPPNSAAITYARKNNIGYACDLSQASVTGVKRLMLILEKLKTSSNYYSWGKQNL